MIKTRAGIAMDKMKEAPATAVSDESLISPVAIEKDIAQSRPSSASSHSSDSDAERITVEAYNDLGEPTGIITRKSSHTRAGDLSRHVTGVSIATNNTMDPGFEIDFADDDPGDPKNWPLWKRGIIIFFISYSTLVV